MNDKTAQITSEALQQQSASTLTTTGQGMKIEENKKVQHKGEHVRRTSAESNIFSSKEKKETLIFKKNKSSSTRQHVLQLQYPHHVFISYNSV